MNSCFKLAEVIGNKTYKINFSLDGNFHIRFCITEPNSDKHLEFLTKNIYGSAGEYTYILTPSYSGDLCLCKSADRENSWITAHNITVEEV